MSVAFERYIGIDYSGAETCESGLKGLRVYLGDRATEPREVAPPGPRKNWTRRAIAHWLFERLPEPVTTLVGSDHGFSFPLRYFEKYDRDCYLLGTSIIPKHLLFISVRNCHQFFRNIVWDNYGDVSSGLFSVCACDAIPIAAPGNSLNLLPLWSRSAATSVTARTMAVSCRLYDVALALPTSNSYLAS